MTIASHTTTLTVLLLGAVAGANAQTPTAQPEISKDTREKMAALHEQMASCLRSDKSVADCHSEVLKSCKEQLETDSCPLLGLGHATDHHMHPMGATPK
jgi:hypothetical protein